MSKWEMIQNNSSNSESLRVPRQIQIEKFKFWVNNLKFDVKLIGTESVYGAQTPGSFGSADELRRSWWSQAVPPTPQSPLLLKYGHSAVFTWPGKIGWSTIIKNKRRGCYPDIAARWCNRWVFEWQHWQGVFLYLCYVYRTSLKCSATACFKVSMLLKTGLEEVDNPNSSRVHSIPVQSDSETGVSRPSPKSVLPDFLARSSSSPELQTTVWQPLLRTQGGRDPSGTC